MNLLEALKRRILLSDGAMGTQLQQAGLPPGGCGEAWNLDASEKVLAIQRAYVAAGSDILITNSFGGSRIMLERHDEGRRVRDINRAAAEIARHAFNGREGFVLGDIGPFGGLMEPYGEVPQAQVEDAFAEQAEALVEAGVDAIIIETQTSLEELGIAIEAAKAAGAPCVIGSMAFDKMQDEDEVRTMMGTSPEQAAAFMAEAGADLVALNCGTGVDMKFAADTARRYRSTCTLPIMVQPNAGLPVLENLQVVYKETPDEMARGLPAVLEAGAGIVGGCCGSTPAHIAKLREVLDGQGRARS
ncbi:MAG TPA: homocysteine S-methyltransferase family protein [Vicinamibacteria bacterium]|nr:homocysteine S-methyltransferase family protein [Vicinamibacteria bacterium]